MESSNELIFFNTSSGNNEFQVILDSDIDTVWLTQSQMSSLFGKSKGTISEYIKNIFTDEELDQFSTVRDFRIVQNEGGREINRKLTHYNLDVIISVGYRVKSKEGIYFRKWATQKLKEHLIKGYTINDSIKNSQIVKLKAELQVTYSKLYETQSQLTDGLLSIIENYSKSFELLNLYDTDDLQTDNLNENINYVINYDDVKKAISQLKKSLILKGEASELFGNEKDDSFKGILGSISQTVFGNLAYPTIEEQASQLLYSIIKGHSFSDGNKRIGSFVFIWFLTQNNYHLKENGSPKINDNTLVTIALAVAQSLPIQRDIIIKLIINLIKS